jgi:membrane protein required for colicin V production
VSPFDLFFAIIVGLSALYALSRGLVTELLSLSAWVAAFVLVRMLHAPVSAWLGKWFEINAIADVLALLIIFFTALFFLRWAASSVGESVKKSAIGVADRLLGMAFGAMRGLFIISLAYLGLALIIPADRMPRWIVAAKTYPVVQHSATILSGLSGKINALNALYNQGFFEDGVPGGELQPEGAPGPEGDDEEQRQLEELLKKQSQTKI